MTPEPTSSPAAIADRARHAIDYRVSLVLPFVGACYVTLLAGPEKRNAGRLDREGQRGARRRAGLLATVALLLAGCLLFGALSGLYLLKCLLGINLFEGASPLHPLYELFFG